jgi:hypothetical protein
MPRTVYILDPDAILDEAVLQQAAVLAVDALDVVLGVPPSMLRVGVLPSARGLVTALTPEEAAAEALAEARALLQGALDATPRIQSEVNKALADFLAAGGGLS